MKIDIIDAVVETDEWNRIYNLFTPSTLKRMDIRQEPIDSRKVRVIITIRNIGSSVYFEIVNHALCMARSLEKVLYSHETSVV